MRLEIVPLLADHLEDAAALVASRYCRQMQEEPLLTGRFQDRTAVNKVLQGLVTRGEGVVALTGGRFMGFLVGRESPSGGAYIPDVGHGVRREVGRDAYRAMYAVLASRWVESGHQTHTISVPAHDHEAMEAWFSLGFGLTTVDAIRGLEASAGSPSEVEIVQADGQDREVIRSFDRDLRRHLASSPAFVRTAPDDFTTNRFANAGGATWIAYRRGLPVAFLSVEPSANDPVILARSDESAVSIVVAFTREEVR